MSIYAAVIGTIAGICLGYAILFLFAALRRHGDRRRLNLSFALFALGYAGTLLLGIAYRSQETVADYLAVSRWDGIFIWLAFVALNWYVAEYTGVRARGYLWGFTAVFTIAILAALLTPTLSFSEMPEFASIPLPWNEEVPTLAGEENVWGVLLLLGQLATLGFIIFAGVWQWRQGEKQADLRLSLELLLSEQPGVEIVGVASESSGLLALIETSKPDMIVSDWELLVRPLVTIPPERDQSCPRLKTIVPNCQ
jgi:MFS family permease